MIFTPKGVPILPTNIIRVHSPRWCLGPSCVIHSPSNHPLNGAPIWIALSTAAYRLCDHGIMHPDPDSQAFFKARKVIPSFLPRVTMRHNRKCDGCCK